MLHIRRMRKGWGFRSLSRFVLVTIVASLFASAFYITTETPQVSLASHIRGGSLNWTKNPNTPNTADFEYSQSLRRSAFAGTDTDGRPKVGDTINPGSAITFGDGNSTTPSMTVMQIDKVNDVLTAEASVSHTYSSVGPFTAFINWCCRLSSPPLVNNHDGTVQLQTIVNFPNLNGSPESAIPPVVDCPKNAVCSFTIPATDPNYLPVQYRFSTATEAGGSFTQPPNATISSSGVYSWDTTNATLFGSGDTYYTTQVMIETLSNGSVVTKTAIEFFIRISANAANRPVFNNPTPADGTVIGATTGQPVSFSVNASSPLSANTIALIVANNPGGSFVTSGTNPASGTFTWTPMATGSYILTLEAEDQTTGLSALPRSITILVTAVPASVTPNVTSASAQTGQAFGQTFTGLVKDGANNPIPGAAVTCTLSTAGNGASGTFAGGGTTKTVTTDANGVATCPAVTANGTGGSYTLTMTAGSASGVINLTNNAPITLGSLTANTASASTAVNSNFGQSFSVVAKDTNNQPMANVSITCSLSTAANGASGSFSGVTTVVTDATGTATCPTVTANTKAGNYTLTFSSGGLTATTALTNTAGSPAGITVPASATSVPVNSQPGTYPVVTVVDQFGNPVSGVTVTFTAPGSGATGTFQASGNATDSGTSDASGNVTLPTYTANGTTGTYSISVSVGGITANIPMQNTVGSAASVTMSPTSASTTVNTAFSQTFTGTVKDSGGNVIANASATCSLPGSGASGTFQGGGTSANVTADANGLVTCPAVTANTVAGTYNLTITSGSASGTAALTNNADTAVNITGPANTTTVQINTQVSNPPVVTVTDQYGNPVSNVYILFVAPQSGPSGTFANGPNQYRYSGSDGTAALPNFTANSIVGTYTIIAGIGNAGVNIPMQNTVGSAASVTMSPTSASTTVNTAFSQTFTGTVKDSGGNPVPNASATCGLTTAGNGATGSFGGTTIVTADANGLVTCPVVIANTKAGSYSLTITSGAASGNAALTNTAGAPASISVPASTTSVPVNSQPGTYPTVTVLDQFGNPVSGVSVTFTAPGSGASGTFQNNTATTSATSDASGNVTLPTYTANGTTGTYNIVANIGGITANIPMQNTAGSAGSVTMSPTSASATVNTAFSQTFTGTVKDSGGNVIPNASATCSLPASGASGTFQGGGTSANVTADANGVVTCPAVTANTKAGTYNLTITSGAASGTAALTNTADVATTIKVPANTTSVQVNTQVGSSPVVTVVDQFDNPVSGVSVTFTAPGSGASGKFAGNSLTTSGSTGANGQLTLPTFTANGTTGTYNIVASINSGAVTGNIPMQNTAGSVGSVTMSPTSASTTVNTAFSQTFTGTVKDSGGNPVPNASATCSLPASGASGTFQGGGTSANVTADANGLVTCPAVTANTKAGTYNLTITSGAASGTAALTNNAGNGASITGPGTTFTTQINTVFNPLPSVTVKDSFGNPVAGVVVTFTAPNSGPSGTFGGGVSTITATTNASGVANMPTFTANGTFGNYNVTATIPGNISTSIAMTNSNSGSQGLLYYPLPKPIRLLDTRPGTQGKYVGTGRLVSGGVFNQMVGGQTYQNVTIPAAAKAVEATTTIAKPSASGFLTLYPGPADPTAANWPVAATMTFNQGQDYLTNSANLTLGSDGSVNIFSSAGVDVVLDVYGYYAPIGTPDPNNNNRTDTGLVYFPLSQPARAIDTRGNPAFYNQKATMNASSTLNYKLAGITIGNVTIPANAKALTGNTQVALPSAAGFLTLYPGPADPNGSNWPVASNLVFNGGEYLSNSMVLNLGSDSTINIYAFQKTDVVLDITGYYVPYTQNPTGLQYYTFAKPVRFLDTRTGGDAYSSGSGPIANGGTRNFGVTGITYKGANVPANAKVIEATMGATSPNTGFLTVYPGPNDPTGANRPTSTNLIFQANRFLANGSKMLLGSDGSINIYAFQSATVTLDITGYFA